MWSVKISEYVMYRYNPLYILDNLCPAQHDLSCTWFCKDRTSDLKLRFSLAKDEAANCEWLARSAEINMNMYESLWKRERVLSDP